VATTAEQLTELGPALTNLAAVFGDAMTAEHVGSHMTCDEADALASVLRLAGHADAAATFLDGHASTDDEPEDVHHGRHIRARVLDRYSELLRRAAIADPAALPGDAFRVRWNAARARLADADRYADGQDWTARYELPSEHVDTSAPAELPTFDPKAGDRTCTAVGAATRTQLTPSPKASGDVWVRLLNPSATRNETWTRDFDVLTQQHVEVKAAPCGLGCHCAAQVRLVNPA
jgi:hypothetical protein